MWECDQCARGREDGIPWISERVPGASHEALDLASCDGLQHLLQVSELLVSTPQPGVTGSSTIVAEQWWWEAVALELQLTLGSRSGWLGLETT